MHAVLCVANKCTGKAVQYWPDHGAVLVDGAAAVTRSERWFVAYSNSNGISCGRRIHDTVQYVHCNYREHTPTSSILKRKPQLCQERHHEANLMRRARSNGKPQPFGRATLHARLAL